MKLCSCEHEEICFDSRGCPLCEAVEKIASLEEENERLNDQLREISEHEQV